MVGVASCGVLGACVLLGGAVCVCTVVWCVYGGVVCVCVCVYGVCVPSTILHERESIVQCTLKVWRRQSKCWGACRRDEVNGLRAEHAHESRRGRKRERRIAAMRREEAFAGSAEVI